MNYVPTSWGGLDEALVDVLPIPAVPSRPTEARHRVKRGLDVVLALLGIALLAPVLLAIALGIKLTTGGPVLYVQPRVGEGFRVFNLIKFRTMVVGAHDLTVDYMHLNEASGPLFKIRDDPRLTPFGRFLRRHFLDELPQLWNVVVGEMSLVGPRPVLAHELVPDPAWMPRFSVPQGITGPWQTSGHHGITFEEQVRVELEYIDRWSLLGDFVILFKTIPLVLFRRGL